MESVRVARQTDTKLDTHRHFSGRSRSLPSLIGLQRTAGNAAVGALLRAGIAHAKLRVAPANDPLEREADSQAKAFTGDGPCSCGGTCDECKANGNDVKRTASDVGSPARQPTDIPESVVSNLGSARPLEPLTREPLEAHFGRDFSSVRIHDGPEAAAATTSVQARAFALGNSIAFNTGEFAPDTPDGKRLLAHELTHVVQQGPSDDVQRKAICPDMPPPTVPAGCDDPSKRRCTMGGPQDDITSYQQDPDTGTYQECKYQQYYCECYDKQATQDPVFFDLFSPSTWFAPHIIGAYKGWTHKYESD